MPPAGLPPASPPSRTVVCFGDSITYGQVSASYIEILDQRLAPAGFRFVNAGVNNDMTDNLLRRVSSVTAHRPDFVTVLAGTNDVIASLSYRSALFYILNKRIYRWPTLEGSYHRLAQIIRALKSTTRAAIGVASIPVLGEDLDSRPMQHVRRYNQQVARIAAREGVAYLPVFEKQTAFLLENGKSDGRVYYNGSYRETARLVTHRLFLLEDFDTFSARMGYQLLVDGVHMNTVGAAIIADTIETFLRESAEQRSPFPVAETTPG